MTTYYCDLGESTFADVVGDTNNPYTGPAGLQAAVRGTGNATSLTGSDTLKCKGTGDLSRLVLLHCPSDVSAWAPGDAVGNDVGDGDDWTGVVVQANDDPVGQLGDDGLLLVWLDGDTYSLIAPMASRTPPPPTAPGLSMASPAPALRSTPTPAV